jgi:hypothetical protein
MGTYMKIGWTPLEVHNIFSIYNNIYNNNNNNNNNKHKRSIGYWIIDRENGNTNSFNNV